MNRPLPTAHEKFISIGFKDGEFIFGPDGEYPAGATLSADLTAASDGWQIATVYLGSQASRDETFHELTGPAAEKAKRVLLDDDEFNAWANRHCRGLDDSARLDQMRDFFDGLSGHLSRINEAA